VLIGPHTYNFTQASVLALEHGAAVRVADGDSLARTLQQLLQQPERLAQMGTAGLAFVNANRGATEQALTQISHAITCT
jgi:3-deoxy-D-manno-octulosonic-acid transferase